MKRFYTAASVQEAQSGFIVCLDAKPIHTPAKNILCMPARTLAEAIAAEWNAQSEMIDKSTMPLTRLATIANDLLGTEHETRETILEELLGYGDTDLTLHLAPETALQIMQQEYFLPVLLWLKETHDMRVELSGGIMPAKQPAENKERLRAILTGLDAFRLAALATLTPLTGSLFLSLYFMEGKISPEDLANASRLEELYQIQKWGKTEAHADRESAMHAEIETISQFLVLLQQPTCQ